MLWLTVMHTSMVNRAKMADWSKWFRITLQSCFCSLLTSNWEVSTGRFLNSFLITSEVTKQFVIIWFIEDNETNLPIKKHTLRVLYDNLKKMFAKFGFDASFMWLFLFVAIRVTFNDLCCWLLSRIHLSLKDQSWETGPNEFVLHLKVVFPVC